MKFYTTKAERELARSIAADRDGAKDREVRRRDISPFAATDSSHPHRLGAVAEVVWSRLSGGTINALVFSDRGDDVDFGEVEIKASTWPGEDIELKVPVREWDRKRPQVYVLARVDRDLKWVEWVGAISRARFERVKVMKNYGYFDNWIVAGTMLAPVTRVIDLSRWLP